VKKAPGLCQVETRTSTFMARAVVGFAVAAVLTVNGVQIAAAAGPSPATMPADAQSIARRLATVASAEPIASCDNAPASSGSLFAMFNALGAAPDPSILSTPALQVMCSLPYTNGKPGGDCTGKHTLTWKVLGATASAKISSELVGLDANGTLLNSFIVKNGDTAQLASRLSPSDWKFQKGSSKDFTVFAPVPLLHVTVEDQGQKAEAFCSNIPWVDVVQPNGGVVSESSGNTTNVLAAVPLTNPAALHLFVDGVDLLKPGVIAPPLPALLTACSASFPCDGTATVNGSPVQVTGLIVDIASSISALSSNTVRATLTDLACGGHIVKVTSSKLPGTLKNPTSEACDVDDLADKSSLSVFSLRIDSPLADSINNSIPTAVAGEVCSGTQVTDVNINGKSLPVSIDPLIQTFTLGNGDTSGDVWKVTINTTLLPTDVAADNLKGTVTALGTFDPGTNRLAASAREIQGNRTYKTFIFATGLTAPIGKAAGFTVVGDPNANIFQKAAVQSAVHEQLKKVVESSLPVALAETQTELQNAFIVGLSAGGTQTLFNKLCSEPNPLAGNKTLGQIFSESVTAQLLKFDQAHPISSFTLHLGACPSCDPGVSIFVSSVNIGTNVTCPITFSDGKFSVAMNLPDVSVTAKAAGHCKDEACVLDACVCLSETTVDFTANFSITGINLGFDVTEGNLLNTSTSDPNFHAGAGVQGSTSGGVSFDCIGGDLCQFALDVISFFTGIDALSNLDDLHLDFKTQIEATKPDPVKLKQIKVDEQVVANFDQKMSGAVSEVHITPAGITAGLKGTFATTVVDEGIPDNPGITLTPAPVPTMAEMKAQGAQDALIGLSDDTINMMFASLTAAGKLKGGDAQGCFPALATVGSLLPQGPGACDTLSIGGDNIATAVARGHCHAIKGDSCGSLVYNGASGVDAFLTSKEQGVCYGASGTVCSQIPNSDAVKQFSCSITPNFNLHADQSLIFCAKGDVPPRMLFPNDGSPASTVPTALRLNDLTVALMIDRSGPPNLATPPNGVIDAPLGTLPSCFASGANNKSDCNVFAACLDLGLNFNMKNITCPANPTILGDKPKHGFKAEFSSIQLLNRQLGVVCSGVTSPTGDTQVIAAASDDTITIPLGQSAGTFSPDICGAGLDLGGFVSCTSPSILAIEADGLPAMKDYLGITCTIQ
jgi:hypothetical protein